MAEAAAWRPPGRHPRLSRVTPRPVSLAARIRELETALVELRNQQRVELLAAIALVVEHRCFSARELWEHRIVAPVLAAAFGELNIGNARQLGKKLRALGLERIGADHGGAIWMCR